MIIVGNGIDDALGARTFRSMFEERKRVFVDLLGWNIPTLANRYEIDQFDDDQAVYVVVTDLVGNHCGSARLLRTDQPHILDTIFPDLCQTTIPRGTEVREITRFCLSRSLRASERMVVRNRLISALVEHALTCGIATYTGVAELGWFRQILAFGWDCEQIGYSKQTENQTGLAAMRIAITNDTPELLRAAGIYLPTSLVDLDREAA